MKWWDISNSWPAYVSRAKRTWPDLSIDDLIGVSGHRHLLEQKLREKLGISQEQAEEEVMYWQLELSRL